MAVSFEMFVLYKNRNLENLTYTWIFIAGPAAGAVAAAFLFQIYKRLVPQNPVS